MAKAASGKKRVPNERPIEDAIMANPAGLRSDYAGAFAVRHMKAGKDEGVVDVMLFPKKGPHRIVLVEAKADGTGDSAPQIIKQLQKYQSGAVRFGKQGLAALVAYAKKMRRAELAARAAHVSLVEKKWISAQRVWSVTKGLDLTPTEAWARMCHPPLIDTDQVGLYLALNYQPKDALRQKITELYETDGITVGIAVARPGQPIKMIWPDGSPEAAKQAKSE